MDFNKDVGLMYAVAENYDYGGLLKEVYLNAVKAFFELIKEKYGESDYRVREMFALMQRDDWEGRFGIRSLIHAVYIGCPHNSLEECHDYKSAIELNVEKEMQDKNPDFKIDICTHCSHLESLKEKWEKKLSK